MKDSMPARALNRPRRTSHSVLLLACLFICRVVDRRRVALLTFTYLISRRRCYLIIRPKKVAFKWSVDVLCFILVNAV